ncbi:TonB-dependent receptor plug domain-containing protein [Thioalkalivibrio denitrificans]|uniref:TonB-dependent receptor plug domain-containing protein n=1 Tax=Thioalkalivibrio denitrificans TaxID=108003 RepID=UPI001FE7AD02|nr:TonB-dependent receptor plug domain-containing protein [Thioalkalivibrio denitrificans]
MAILGPGQQTDAAEPPLTEHDFFADMPVVLTATRLRQPVSEAPAAVTIIDREMIDASGARELVDILRLVPGMIVARHSNHEPVVTYGGLPERFARRMQVLVDGRSVYQPFSGGVLWPDLGLAIEDIARIEVIRGPNAAAYGPNSFQGIINIITRHPAEIPGRHVTTRVGNNGGRDLIGRQAGRQGDLDYRLTLSTQEDDGFPDGNDDKRAYFADLRLDYRLTHRHTFSTYAGAGQSRKGRGRPAEDLDPERHFTTDRAHVHLKLEQDAATDQSWTLEYAYQQYRTVDEFDVAFLGLRVPIDENVRTERHDLGLEHRRHVGAATRVVWGGGIRHDRVVSPTYFGEHSPVSDDLYRAFASFEHLLGDVTTLNLGAMYEHSRLFGDEISPRAALNVRAHPRHTLRFIAARATRTPVLTEELAYRVYDLTDHGVPPPNNIQVVLDAEGGLKPETMEYFELGHHQTFEGTRLTLDSKLFSTRIRGLIDASRASTSFADRGDVSYEGVEVQADYRPTLRTRLHGGFTHHFYRTDDRDGRYADAIPRNILTTAISSRVSDALTLSARYYWYSEVDWVDGAPMGTYDGFLDLSARWSLNRGAHLGITVQDILARGYDGRGPDNSEIYQVNRREPRSFATLSVDF